MREIKFRAWNVRSQNMFSAETMTADQMCLLPTGRFINVHQIPIMSTIYSRDRMIPMQFTGKVDINGAPIYEGDILEQHGDPSMRYPVTYDEYAAAFVMMGRHGDEPDFLGDFNTSYIRIIGNIYENPELIKVGSK